MFFLIFLELHLLDLCVNMASVWKIFLTCGEKYFFSHVMDFSVKKKTRSVNKMVTTRKIKEIQFKRNFKAKILHTFSGSFSANPLIPDVPPITINLLPGLSSNNCFIHLD